MSKWLRAEAPDLLMLGLRVGDRVRPRPEWRDDANRVPSGRVRAVVPWGDCGVVYVEGDHRGFCAWVFEIDDYDAN